jgi:hypothetical protein
MQQPSARRNCPLDFTFNNSLAVAVQFSWYSISMILDLAKLYANLGQTSEHVSKQADQQFDQYDKPVRGYKARPYHIWVVSAPSFRPHCTLLNDHRSLIFNTHRFRTFFSAKDSCDQRQETSTGATAYPCSTSPQNLQPSPRESHQGFCYCRQTNLQLKRRHFSCRSDFLGTQTRRWLFH